ncbi:MAG: fluoride efflux transporter CrcB [Bacillota bacterium]|uniref:Fluoride-specific ion channel FluC n=1 Tax=Thermanaerosceptrum fracticalcis TaxID=1712410 RepID=A0A7G6DYR2_THEFR|nr:fluoride efflux transporter CrcB [Thermanaerosceptrum fracticalcis]QNB44966.1 fluoride efflux transporter CrcB [Thermanaerosceptrum fracticalcis]
MHYATYAFIALGGALGALGRYFLSTWIYERGEYIFPWGTFVVNMLGCFLLGLVYVLGVEKLVINPNTRAFLAVGFLGAFTTFSTFSLETLNIIKNGQIKIALLNGAGSLLIGLVAVWLGTVAAQLITK